MDPNEQLDEDVEEVRWTWVPKTVCPCGWGTMVNRSRGRVPEMTQQLRAFTDLYEDTSLVSNTWIWQLTNALTSAANNLVSSSGFLGHPHTRAYTYTYMDTYKMKRWVEMSWHLRALAPIEGTLSVPGTHVVAYTHPPHQAQEIWCTLLTYAGTGTHMQNTCKQKIKFKI